MKPDDESTLFRETQPMHQNMVIRVLIPFEAVVTLGILIPVIITQGRGGVPMPVLVMLIGLGVLLPMGLFLIRLETIVTDRRVIVRMRPFPGRDIDAGRIISAEAVRYNPLSDAGGWGWRGSRRYHRVFNVSGDRGVHVRYGDDRKDQFLVGSRKPDELAEAIDLARFAATEPEHVTITAGSV